MSINREEIQVKLGIDNSQVGGGLAQAESALSRFADKVEHKFTKKLNKVVFGGLVGMAFHFAKELLPTAEEFWDWVYGVDEKNTSRTEKFLNRMRELRESVLKLKEAFEKKAEANFFDSLADPARAMYLKRHMEELTDSAVDAQKLMAQLEEKRDSMSPPRPTVAFSLDPRTGFRRVIPPTEQQQNDYLKERQALTEKIAATDLRATQIAIDKVETEKKLRDVEREITKQKQQQAEAVSRQADAEGRKAKQAYDEWLLANKRLSDAMGPDRPGVGDIDPSGAGYWEHIHGRSGLGSNRFVPRRLTEEDIRIRDRAEKIAELKEAAERTAKVLEGFDANGIFIKASD